MRYLETGSHDPAYNLAFEEYVLKNRTQGSYLLLWQNDKAVIVGANQNTETEINRCFIEENRICVIRRSTGGGAVYHDLGNLNYSFITDAGTPASAFVEPVVQALRSLGLDACASGRNDILVDGRKVSGTAQQICGSRTLHHGTLLFDTDPERIAGALNPDPEKYQAKGVPSVRSRVGSIRAALRQDMDLPAFWDFLKTALADCLEPDQLTPEERTKVMQLKKEKYDTWQWNFGRSPRFATYRKRRFPGGSLEVHLTVVKGKLTEFKILGDFLAVTELSPLENALLGCEYSENALKEVLSSFDLTSYLGSITQTELIKTILDT